MSNIVAGWGAFRMGTDRSPSGYAKGSLIDFNQYKQNCIQNTLELIRELAGRIRARAIKSAPIDTGRLRGSHLIQIGLGEKRQVYMATRTGGRFYGRVANTFKLGAVVAATAPYAIYVHEGTYKMISRPWFRPLVQEARKRLNIRAKNQMLGKPKRSV